MKILPRTQFGNPLLRAKAKTIPTAFIKTAAFKRLVREMFYTMHRVQGVGLAAPQVDQPIRLAVIGATAARTGEGQSLRRVIVNPRIIWHSRNILLDWEGCLSFSDGRGQVPRWASIQVEYVNEKGKRIKEKHSGFAARVFQHEIDHLNGILYVDRMPNMKTLMTHQEFIKQVLKMTS